MQLNAFTDYSLRVLIYAAVRGDRCLTSDVASAFGVSRHHVVKVVHRLQALGYLETTRGRTGGFRLAQPPDEIRVGDVVRRTEGTLALVESSFEDAIEQGIQKADDSLRGIRGAWVDGQEVVVENGKISAYKVRLKVTIVLD